MDNIDNGHNSYKRNNVLLDQDQKGTFRERLQLLAGDESGRKFAARTDVVYSTLHNYLIGLNVPTFDNLAKIAAATDVNLDWLVLGNGQMYKTDISNNTIPIDTLGHSVDLDEFYFVPRYNIKASAGHGAAIGEEAPMHQMAFRKYWVDNILHVAAKGLAVIGVKGDSMFPVINDKDVLLININDTSLRDGIYVIRLNEDLIVKRIQVMIGGIIKIVSANNVYEPFEVNLNDLPSDFAIIGRVVWFGRTVP